jgi:hypothetical protein
MMKKAMWITVISLVVLALAAAMVSAATPANLPPFARNQANLTDAQKQELAPLFQQMVEVRKQIIQKQVEFGNLTQEQADQRIAWMQQRSEQGCDPGMMGRGPGKMRGGSGFGGGPRWQEQQAVK